MPAVRTRARVEGVVQGVGFRPFVHRLAGELQLDGFVRNDERGVLLEVEGEAARVGRFLLTLRSAPPPLAVVERVLAEDVEPRGRAGFVIVESDEAGPPAALVSPDVATCADCLAELFDPADRRYRYPFVNCTNCGPRFTIVRGVPYDRPRTTMAGFAMCAACRAEYEDPGDRRFHDTIADATAIAVVAAAEAYGLGTAVLSGGVFLNRRLLAATVATLERTGLRVIVPERLPPGDGGISYGQAAVAAAQDR